MLWLRLKPPRAKPAQPACRGELCRAFRVGRGIHARPMQRAPHVIPLRKTALMLIDPAFSLESRAALDNGPERDTFDVPGCGHHPIAAYAGRAGIAVSASHARPSVHAARRLRRTAEPAAAGGRADSLCRNRPGSSDSGKFAERTLAEEGRYPWYVLWFTGVRAEAQHLRAAFNAAREYPKTSYIAAYWSQS